LTPAIIKVGVIPLELSHPPFKLSNCSIGIGATVPVGRLNWSLFVVMRFFRNRRPKAWHSAAVGGDRDHNPAASIDDGKRSRRTSGLDYSYCYTEAQASEFNNIASGRSTPTHMHHHNDDNNCDDKKWMRRCQLLQRCVEEFDVEERYYQERIHSLERQLERLLAADGGADDYHQSRRLKKSMSCETDATIPLSCSASFSSFPTQIDDDQSNIHHDHDARQEIASLEELLSKVVAENKVLTSKVENLTSIIKSYTPPDNAKKDETPSKLPPSIMDIDLTLALESCTPNTTSNEEPIKYVMHLKGKDYRVIYKSRVNGDLILKVNEHHEDIWRKIKEYRKKKNKKSSANRVKYASTKFANSDFADHIVSCHLYNAKSLKEVKAWWQDNVKVLEKL